MTLKQARKVKPGDRIDVFRAGKAVRFPATTMKIYPLDENRKIIIQYVLCNSGRIGSTTHDKARLVKTI